MNAEQETKTLVLVCHRNFCRLLDRMLRTANIDNFRHGDLSLLFGSTDHENKSEHSEVYIVTTEASQAQRFITTLNACPLRAEQGTLFELYLVGEARE